MIFKFLEFVPEPSVSTITKQAINQKCSNWTTSIRVLKMTATRSHSKFLPSWQNQLAPLPNKAQSHLQLAYLSTSAKIHTYKPLNGELIASLLMMREQCEQSAATMRPLVRWKRFHIWSGGKNEVKWWNIDYVSSSNWRKLPERITNEKFMFIIHKPAAYASAISIYIINIAQYCKIYRYYPENISMANSMTSKECRVRTRKKKSWGILY